MLFRCEFHFATTEALEIGKAGMGAYEDVVGFAGADGFGHYERVARAGGFSTSVWGL